MELPLILAIWVCSGIFSMTLWWAVMVRPNQGLSLFDILMIVVGGSIGGCFVAVVIGVAFLYALLDHPRGQALLHRRLR